MFTIDRYVIIFPVHFKMQTRVGEGAIAPPVQKGALCLFINNLFLLQYIFMAQQQRGSEKVRGGHYVTSQPNLYLSNFQYFHFLLNHLHNLMCLFFLLCQKRTPFCLECQKTYYSCTSVTFPCLNNICPLLFLFKTLSSGYNQQINIHTHTNIPRSIP